MPNKQKPKQNNPARLDHQKELVELKQKIKNCQGSQKSWFNWRLSQLHKHQNKASQQNIFFTLVAVPPDPEVSGGLQPRKAEAKTC